ncbi:MAG: TrkH family potassium uptake protein [Clostridiales bacterium]|nr:TrkH family potassium uptake protein [Clostridiales bacterium]
MNYRMIAKIVGRVIGIEAVLLLIPTFVSLHFHEGKCVNSFLLTIVLAAAVSLLFFLISRHGGKKIFSKEGFVSVALSWVVMSLIGALPFFITREIPSYIDAFFETVSGFTTTGSSILTDIEAMSRGLLFWRSFTHWIGGMGILVFMLAFVPTGEEYSMHIVRAEVPGPEAGKLTAKVQRSSLILYLIYFVLTITEITALLICKMPLFDSVVHAMGTAGTGGFGIKSTSIGAYSSAAQVVIAVFMFLFGVNFNIYFFILMRRFRVALKDSELHFYFLAVTFATLTISINIRNLSVYADGFGHALRDAFFQVTSIASTTGFTTTNFDLWPQYSKTILIIIMFMGACAGSTAGGIKVSRVLILLKTIKAEIKHMLHPHSFNPVMINGKTIQKETLRGTLVYFAMDILLVSLGFIVISLDEKDFVTTFSSVITCISNVGPAFSLVGPAGNFEFFSPLSKITLSILMLMGRLELIPMVILFNPTTWKRRGQF